jgi:predicted anti-sigma-YlaC factor YlaD
MQNFFQIDIAYAVTGSITNAPRITHILLNALQFLLSIVGIVAIIGLVFAGFIYLTSGGDEKRITYAKKSALASVVGIAVALGAFVIVSQLVEFFL